MKKQLLFASSIFVSGLLCAQVAGKVTKIPSNLANIAVQKSKKVDDQSSTANASFQGKALIKSAKNVSRVANMTENVIGNTFYDLQTNSSVGDRLVVNADGSIAACWTYDDGATSTSYTNRGTGYAYYNGSTWSAAPTARVENARVGWGNVVNTRSGQEVILSHNGGASKAHVASRATKGTGAWANSTTSFPAVTGGNWWPRMVSSSPVGGDTIYALSISYPVANGGTAYNGLDGAVLFSRSTDGGATWDIQNQQPTGFTSANYLGFGGDAYAITAKGSTVAVVAGDSDSDIGLAKSTDGGVTWTYKTIFQFPIHLWDNSTTISDVNGDAVADTIQTNDGSFAVSLDNNGKAYVAYGAFRLLEDDLATAGYSYFPYTDGLYLWDETMPQNAGGTIVAGIEDLNGDNYISFPTPTSGLLPFGSFGTSLTSYPSLAFDASNTMYLSYSSVVDSMLSVATDPQLVRHTYVIKSTDGGATFTAPYDVVPHASGAETEGMFPSMAKNVNGFVHLIYQRDFFPGYGVPPATGTDPDPQNVNSPSDIVYVKIPVAEIMGNAVSAGVKELTSIASLGFYPNPASSNATITVDLKDNAKMEISILNAVGQTIYSTSVNGNMGNNKVDVNLNSLSAGLYFYQVKVGNSKAITQKFAVEK